jgi:general secretion pathway protein N
MRKSTISVPGILLLSCAGLLWLNLPYLRPPSANDNPTIPKAAQSRQNVSLPAEPALNVPPLRRFTETLERPLFSSTRRPPEVAIVAAKPAPKAAPLNLILKGVIFSPQERIAIVAPKLDRRDQTILRLSVGATYQGWTLKEIAPKAATFRHGDAEEHLKLLFDEQPKTQRKSRSRRQKSRSKG